MSKAENPHDISLEFLRRVPLFPLAVRENISEQLNAPGIAVYALSFQMDESRLLGQFLHHILPGGQGGPGFNTYIRSGLLHRMPETDIGHLGEAHTHTAAAFL